MRPLSAGSQMYLESDLIDALVEDLAGALGEVRPIEMQIVGAQLQTEGVQTLDDYRQLGGQPKQTLVQRYLEGCGGGLRRRKSPTSGAGAVFADG